MKIQHRSADNRAPNGWPDRNIGNQRAKIPPDVPVPVRAAVGGGIMPFSSFVVSVKKWQLQEQLQPTPHSFKLCCGQIRVQNQAKYSPGDPDFSIASLIVG